MAPRAIVKADNTAVLLAAEKDGKVSVQCRQQDGKSVVLPGQVLEFRWEAGCVVGRITPEHPQPGRYRKTALVRAKQWWKHGDVPDWAKAQVQETDDGFEVATFEGDKHGAPGDWIVGGDHDDVWPVRKEIFLATYEPV